LSWIVLVAVLMGALHLFRFALPAYRDGALSPRTFLIATLPLVFIVAVVVFVALR